MRWSGAEEGWEGREGGWKRGQQGLEVTAGGYWGAMGEFRALEAAVSEGSLWRSGG